MMDRDFAEPHLRDYINILRRRWIMILVPLLLIPLWQGIPILRMHPTYQSSATLQLEPEKGMSQTFAQSFSPEFFFQNEKWMNNQINIMKGKAVAEKVVKKLGLRLQTKPEERIYQSLLKMWISDFPILLRLLNWGSKESGPSAPFSHLVIRPIEVKDDAKGGYYQGNFQTRKQFTIYDPDGKVAGKGEIGRSFSGSDFSCFVEGVGKEGKSFDFRIVPERNAVMAIQGSLVISPVKETSLINVGVQWSDPVMARDIANAVVESYQETMVSKQGEDISQVLSFIETQLKETEGDLRQAEENLKRFKGREKVINMDAQVKETLEQSTQNNKELNTLAIQRKQAEIVLAALSSPREFHEREALFSLDPDSMISS